MLYEGEGEASTESKSIVALGVRSSSEFSEMVWSMSKWLLKLENGSSDCLLMGLRCRRGGPRGLDGRCTIGRQVVLGAGDECARVICGALREPLPEDLDLRWPLAKGERGRGRNGKDETERVENGDEAVGVSGAVDRRGV